jgi:transmembrane sensor
MTWRISNQGQSGERLTAAAEWLIELRHEELNAARLAEWLDWSQADPANLDAFEQVEALSLGLNTLDPNAKAALLRKLVSEPVQRPRIDRQQRRRVAYALAASIAITILATAMLVAPRSPSLNTTYATAKAENRAFDLPDGSHMELGANTRLDVAYTAGGRTVDLQEGEAFFRVKHDASRPFVVRAGTLHLTDVGTSFDVRRNGAHVVVTVSEGIVDVQRSETEPPSPGGGPAAPTSPRVIRVRAGERVTAESLDRAPVLAKVDTVEAAAWRAGRLTFQDEPLSVVISDINRYARREVVIVDAEVSAMRFTGTVFEDRVDDWVEGTVHLFGLRSEPTADGKLLLHVREPKDGTRRP